jgi:zinc protease
MTATRTVVRLFIVLALASVVCVAELWGQARLDRSITPAPGRSPILRVPRWTRVKLANGAELVVTEKHDLPLVAFSIAFIGGSTSFEPASKIGVASITAEMLSEGTRARSADELSDGQQLLGTSIIATVGAESGTIGFTSLKDRFQPALALLADMLVNAVLPDSALERIRARTLVNLAVAKDQPNAIASNVFAKVLYGDDHPYGRVVTEETVRAITHDDVLAFHHTYFRPGRAVITIAGDVDTRVVRAQVEAALSAWQAGGDRPTFAYPAIPAARERTIYLVDKPQAAQSVFAIGEPGPARNTADYYALQVMNNLLGGLFQSRLNHDIREVKGFSYGVNSTFGYGRGPGAFRAGGGIVSVKSDSALMLFMTHLRGVRGELPFTDDEIKQGKESIIQSLPARLSTVNGLAAAISTIYVQDLSENYFRNLPAMIGAVTGDDLVRVAKQYLDLNHLSIVIVGDRATIEGPLRATGIAPIQILDVAGKPVMAP